MAARSAEPPFVKAKAQTIAQALHRGSAAGVRANGQGKALPRGVPENKENGGCVCKNRLYFRLFGLAPE